MKGESILLSGSVVCNAAQVMLIPEICSFLMNIKSKCLLYCISFGMHARMSNETREGIGVLLPDSLELPACASCLGNLCLRCRKRQPIVVRQKCLPRNKGTSLAVVAKCFVFSSQSI